MFHLHLTLQLFPHVPEFTPKELANFHVLSRFFATFVNVHKVLPVSAFVSSLSSIFTTLEF